MRTQNCGTNFPVPLFKNQTAITRLIQIYVGAVVFAAKFARKELKEMKFNCLLTGVGGEGVLTTQVILARAANLEGHFVRGIQLHGLAQRGGSLQTMVRFGTEEKISSPVMRQGDADLVLAFEPLEAARALDYARQEKTVFVIDEQPLVPIYSHLLGIPYPTLEEIKKKIEPFAKRTHFVPASTIAKEEFGDAIFSNTLLLGVAFGLGALPLKKENIIAAIRISAPRETEKNLGAFERGITLTLTPQNPNPQPQH